MSRIDGVPYERERCSVSKADETRSETWRPGDLETWRGAERSSFSASIDATPELSIKPPE